MFIARYIHNFIAFDSFSQICARRRHILNTSVQCFSFRIQQYPIYQGIWEKLWLKPISQSGIQLALSLQRKTLAETKVFKTTKQVQYLQYYSLVYRDFR
jgi:hypothetical protein